MNGFVRFWKLGAEDADRRVAAILAPVPLESTERYLKTSAVVIAVDRLTEKLSAWWQASRTHQAAVEIGHRMAGETTSSRSRALATVILAAVLMNLALSLAQGSRPGLFWLVIPSMAALFAALVLAGSRSSESQ